MVIKFWGEGRENGFFSNFYYSPFTLDGVRYKTVEHYFQSKKFEGTQYETYINSLTTPKQTAKEGKRRDLPLRSNWEEVKEEVMYRGIKAKFTQNEFLLDMLMKTKGVELIEDSPFDYYWGVGRKETGKNRLGILLMNLRDELEEEGFHG